jgi:hypothetical protein
MTLGSPHWGVCIPQWGLPDGEDCTLLSVDSPLRCVHTPQWDCKVNIDNGSTAKVIGSTPDVLGGIHNDNRSPILYVQ